MDTRKDSATGREKEKEAGAVPKGKEDSCRCKEAAGMTPRELFRLMISDLSFRKKGKK